MLTDDELRDKIHENVIKCGCWVWLKSTGSHGYGQIGIGARTQGLAHRVSYTVFKGVIPEGLVVMHSCDNRLCCNPDHLSVGTYADNTADGVMKGRINGNAARRLTASAVAAIRSESGRQRDIAAKYGTTQPNVSLIKRGITW